MLSFFYTNALEYYAPRIDGDRVLMPFYLPEDFRAPFVDPLTQPARPSWRCSLTPTPTSAPPCPSSATSSPRRDGRRVLPCHWAQGRVPQRHSHEGLLTYFPELAANPLLVDEIIGMAQYAVEYGYFRDDRDTQWSRRIDPGTLSWEQFLRQTDWRGEPVTFGS